MFGVILLPDFALQAALRHEPVAARHEPVGVLDEEAVKPVIFQCNAAALAAGVRPTMTSSQGLARSAGLRLLARSPAQEASVAEALLESAFSCSPWVEATAAGVCTFELKGTLPVDEHLGEGIVAHLERLDLQARVGLAANPDLALLAAHAATPCLRVDDSPAFLADLPLAVLNPTSQTLGVLRRWGIETLGALSALPADEVTRRLRVEGHDLWERAAGRQQRLLRLAQAPESFEERLDFEYEVETLEPVLFVLRRFLDQLVVRLAAIYRVPAELHLRLGFDDGQDYRRSFHIPAPTGNVETLFRVVHTHLENFTAPSPIRSLHLAATPAVASREQFGLFETALRDPNRFGETLARLHAMLGSDHAGVACLEDTHRPDVFHLEAPDFRRLNETPAKGAETPREPPTMGLPLRRTRPPLPIEVEVYRRVPVRVELGVASGSVRAARGPYQLLGGWWEPSSWTVEEWDVELVQGGLYRLCRQADGWFLAGTYD